MESHEELLAVIGQEVNIVMDRPLGSYHPEHKEMYYPINYGYVPGLFAGDGEEQDVYLLGVDEPVQEYMAKIIAVIVRKNDVETKWVAAPADKYFSKEEIARQVNFQEKYFEHEILL